MRWIWVVAILHTLHILIINEIVAKANKRGVLACHLDQREFVAPYHGVSDDIRKKGRTTDCEDHSPQEEGDENI